MHMNHPILIIGQPGCRDDILQLAHTCTGQSPLLMHHEAGAEIAVVPTPDGGSRDFEFVTDHEAVLSSSARPVQLDREYSLALADVGIQALQQSETVHALDEQLTFRLMDREIPYTKPDAMEAITRLPRWRGPFQVLDRWRLSLLITSAIKNAGVTPGTTDTFTPDAIISDQKQIDDLLAKGSQADMPGFASW